MRKLLFLLFLLIPSLSYAAAPDRPAGSVAVAGTIISSSAYNNDLNTIYNYLQNGVSVIAAGTVTNTSVANGAAIAYSKLNLTNSVTGSDIATNTIFNANVAATAAIAYSKLNLSNSIVNADVATGALIDSFKLANITLAGKVNVTSLNGNLGTTSVINTLFNGGSNASNSTFWRGDGTWQNASAIQKFTSNGTFTAPTGVTKVYLTMVGGGASGNSTNTAGNVAGGGAGGMVVNYPYTVVGGNSYTVTIGAGGTAVTSNETSNAGNNTSFDSTIIALGGGATSSVAAGAGSGGFTATASDGGSGAAGGSYNLQGGSGSRGASKGGGGATLFGAGGTGGSTITSGAANSGAGGGGAASAGTASGAGGSGLVIVAY